MNVYKIVKALANHKTLEWNTLVSEVLGPDVHPNRIFGFLLSREALLRGMTDFGISINIEDLILEGFSQLAGHPGFTLSLSHCKDAGAALIAKKSDYFAVGIDIEDENRVVKDNVFDRISHQEDISLRKIEIWCLKEAAFKALMNSQKFPAPVEFSSIKVADGSWSHSPSELRGEWELEIQEGLVIARAFLKN